MFLQGLDFALPLFASESQSQTALFNVWTWALNPKALNTVAELFVLLMCLIDCNGGHKPSGGRRSILVSILVLWAPGGYCCSFLLLIKHCGWPKIFLDLLQCFKLKGAWDNRSFHLRIRFEISLKFRKGHGALPLLCVMSTNASEQPETH